MTPEQHDWLARPTIISPELRSIEGTRWWVFTEEYRVSLPPPLFPITLVIPVGWQFDRASIPAIIPTWIIGKDHLGCLAPAVHDASYQVRGRIIGSQMYTVPMPFAVTEDNDPVPLALSRATTDQFFRLYLLRQRVTPWRANAAFYALSSYWGLVEALGLSEPW